MTYKLKTFDQSIPRRKYYYNEDILANCPECGSDLIENSCTISLFVKSDTDECNLMTNPSGTLFCVKCPVVVFNTTEIQKVSMIGLRGGSNAEYQIDGIINLDAIPENKKHLEIGCAENPVPIVPFLSDLDYQTPIVNKKQGRNDLCRCGSGKKYKRCCGQ